MREQPSPRVEDAQAAIPGGYHETAATAIDRLGVRGSPDIETARHLAAGRVKHADTLDRADEDAPRRRIDGHRLRIQPDGRRTEERAAGEGEDAHGPRVGRLAPPMRDEHTAGTRVEGHAARRWTDHGGPDKSAIGGEHAHVVVVGHEHAVRPRVDGQRVRAEHFRGRARRWDGRRTLPAMIARTIAPAIAIRITSYPLHQYKPFDQTQILDTSPSSLYCRYI